MLCVASLNLGGLCNAGEDEYDQLHKMVEVFGMPPLMMIEASPKKNKLFAKRSVEDPRPGEPRCACRTPHSEKCSLRRTCRHYWELRKVRTQPLVQRSLDEILVRAIVWRRWWRGCH